MAAWWQWAQKQLLEICNGSIRHLKFCAGKFSASDSLQEIQAMGISIWRTNYLNFRRDIHSYKSAKKHTFSNFWRDSFLITNLVRKIPCWVFWQRKLLLGILFEEIFLFYIVITYNHKSAVCACFSHYLHFLHIR